MANQIISMSKLHLILRLLMSGKSQRSISRTAEVSRSTVDKYVDIFKSQSLSLEELYGLEEYDLAELVRPSRVLKPSLEVLYSEFEGIELDLKKVGVTRHHLWTRYKAKHTDGVGYSQFCSHLENYLKSRNISYVFEHKAADKLMIDFAGKKLHITDYITGESKPVEFFVGILPCSGLTFGMACMSQQTPDFLGCLGTCITFIGGVPQAVVTDNLKPAVKKASKYDPELNGSMSDFADHYNTAILPTRAYKPKDKALVEGAVKILYTRVYAHLHDKVFYSLEELNKVIFELVAQHNALPYQNKTGSRQYQFEALEKHELKPLPQEPFVLCKYQQAKVHPNCHVVLSEDKHNYSVPYHYVGQKVEIKYTNERVEVYCNFRQIAIHMRLKAKNVYTTNPAHLHPKHRYFNSWSESFFREEGLKIGEHTLGLISRIFLQVKHPEQAYKLCQGVVQLSKKYGKEQMEQASEICIKYDFITYNKLVYLLQLDYKNADDSPTLNQLPIKHENLRGTSYYQ